VLFSHRTRSTESVFKWANNVYQDVDRFTIFNLLGFNNGVNLAGATWLGPVLDSVFLKRAAASTNKRSKLSPETVEKKIALLTSLKEKPKKKRVALGATIINDVDYPHVYSEASMCSAFNSLRFNNYWHHFDGCYGGFYTPTARYTPGQQFCRDLVARTWGAALCPAYGTPASGFAISLVNNVEDNCARANCFPSLPWDIILGGPSIYPDTLAYIVREFSDAGISGVTGQFENDQGFFANKPGKKFLDYVSGVEVVIIGVSNDGESMPLTMEGLYDGYEVLGNPALQGGVSTFIVPISQFGATAAAACNALAKYVMPPWGPQFVGYVIQMRGEVWVDSNVVLDDQAVFTIAAPLSVSKPAWTIDLSVGFNSSIVNATTATVGHYDGYIAEGKWLPFSVVAWTPGTTTQALTEFQLSFGAALSSNYWFRVLSEVGAKATPISCG